MRGMRGFSLVEMVLALAITCVAGVLLVSILIQNNNIFYQQSTKVSQGLNLNDALSELNKSVRSASFIVEKYPISSPTYFSGPETLILAYPSLDSNKKVISSTYDYVVFSKDAQISSILRKQVFPDLASSRKAENKVLLTNLSYLAFSYKDNLDETVNPPLAKKVEFAVKVAEKAGMSTEESSRSGEINLRND